MDNARTTLLRQYSRMWRAIVCDLSSSQISNCGAFSPQIMSTHFPLDWVPALIAVVGARPVPWALFLSYHSPVESRRVCGCVRPEDGGRDVELGAETRITRVATLRELGS